MPWFPIWKAGSVDVAPGPVYVSMNDYLIHRLRDVPRVAGEGLGLRRTWPRIEGALGLWFAASSFGRRQVSVSIWRSRDDLQRFVRSPDHVRIMRAYHGAGALYTNAWTAETLDRMRIWQQALDRLEGRQAGVPHHGRARLRQARTSS